MRFTGRDAMATTLVGVAVALEVAHLIGTDAPGLSSGRALTAAILALGLGACVMGGVEMATLRDSYARWMSFLGSGAVVAGLAGLISGAFSMAATLAVAVLAMWISATVRRFARRTPRSNGTRIDRRGTDPVGSR